MKNKVCVVTTTRADYGVLFPIIDKLNKDEFMDLQLIVSGTHLLEEFGMTKNEIMQDEFKNFIEVPIIKSEKSSPCEIFAETTIQFENVLKELNPDMVVILGDRSEILAVASVCLMLGIQLAHISGGDVTYGAIDDACRHAITKMANLHFAGSEIMRQRILQMGESPDVVFNVGEPGVENILNTKLMSLEEITKSLDFSLEEKRYAIVTYHPETISQSSPLEQIKILINFINKHSEINYIITQSNIDNGGDIINNYIMESVKGKKNIKFIPSLGRIRYLSSVKHAMMVIGNSSSGLLEVPYLLTPTINIGNRQQGRECENTVINCELNEESLEKAFKIALTKQNISREELDYVYGDGNTSASVVSEIKNYLNNRDKTKKKVFYMMEKK